MGLFGFLLNPVRYVLAHTMRNVFAEEVRVNPVVIHAEAQSDDVGTNVGNQTKKRNGNGYRKPRESLDGFKPQYVAALRPPRTDIEAQRLYNHIRTLAFYLDAIPFFGRRLPFNIGVDSIIGLIPGVGDYIGLLLSLYGVILSAMFGIPIALLGMMLFNVVLDCVLGFIPLVGDALDVAFKANLRNLRLLEDHLISNDGKCGAGTFCLVVPPSSSFMPTDKPPQMSMHPVAGGEQGRASAPQSTHGPLSRLRQASKLAKDDNEQSSYTGSAIPPDGHMKHQWVSTDADGSSAGATHRLQDFRKGTTDSMHGDAVHAPEVQQALDAWSASSVVPNETFTTMRFEAEGLSLYEACEPMIRFVQLNDAQSMDDTLRTKSKIFLWQDHVMRLQRAVQDLQQSFPSEWGACTFEAERLAPEVNRCLQQAGATSSMRLRVAVKRDGNIDVTSAALPPTPSSAKQMPKLVRHDPFCLPSDQLDEMQKVSFTVKTGNRKMYDEARERVHATLGISKSPVQQDIHNAECFDVLLSATQRNSSSGGRGKGQILLTETSIANVVLYLHDQQCAITPSDNLPLLPGMMRQALLSHNLVRQCDISVYEAKQLCQTGKATLFLCNALRGVMLAEWVD